MSQNQNLKRYERKVTPIERLFTRSPYSIVTLVARIKGEITENLLKSAVLKVQQRHPNLRVRIKEDSDGEPWFTSEGAREIPVDVVPRASDDHWIQVHQEASQVPFDFEARPAIHFILVQSPATSELIILCHHIICDGLSLAYLARDLMVHLGDPAREVEVLPDPVPIDTDTLPKDVSLNPIVKFFVNRINSKWKDDKVVFDQEDYENLNEAYWASFEHKLLPVEMSEAETSALVTHCRENSVTVNTALTAAFVGAQYVVQGDKPYHSSIAVAASLRDRMQERAGERMGFYAGIVTPKFTYDVHTGFWANAQRLHKRLKPLFTNKNLFTDFVAWCYLEPTILEAMNFKKLGGLVAPSQSRHQKLSAFAKQDDVVLRLLKRDKRESLERKFMGTAVTNLTRMDFVRTYGALELDRLFMYPGGAFPLVNVNLVLGAVTCSGKLSLVMEYAEQAVDTKTMEQVRDKAMAFLLDENS
jgi:NRPS condensation-like uncharacterized protein